MNPYNNSEVCGTFVANAICEKILQAMQISPMIKQGFTSFELVRNDFITAIDMLSFFLKQEQVCTHQKFV